MSVWFFIWILLSGVLAFFSIWTLFILFRQKKGWKVFAKKHKLRYRTSGMMASPEISGTINGYTIDIFTSEHFSPGQRAPRKMTALEVQIPGTMPMEGAVASDGMVNLVKELNFNAEVKPQHKDWDVSYIARANNAEALEAYLTEERVGALTSLMKVKSFWLIFVFKKSGTLLRIDSLDPCDSAEKIEKLMRKLIATARILELKDGEDRKLIAALRKKTEQKNTLALEEEEGGRIELELEEDEEGPQQPEDDQVGKEGKEGMKETN